MSQFPVNDIASAFKEYYRKNGEPCEWLAGLSLSLQGSALRVSFLHQLFGQWFKTAKMAGFLDAAREILGGNITLELAGDAAPGLPKKPEKQTDFSKQPLADFLDNGQNSLALTCARNIIENAAAPAISVFCGETASGKTLLLTGIANGLAACGKQPVLAKARLFLANSPLLARLYAGLSWHPVALLLDDLQAIAEEPPLQAKLAEFMDLAADNTRLVFAWQGTVASLGRLQPPLRQRLEKGAVFFLQKADLAARLRYIERTAAEFGLPLKKEMMLYLGRQAQDLPAVHGFLEKIRVFRVSCQKLPDENELARLLENQAPAQRLDWQDILGKVCARLQLEPAQVLEDSRKPDILLGRQLAMYLCRSRLGLSFTELGRLFGGKDHSTVMHSVNKIEKLKDTHKITRNLLTELEKSLA